MDNSKTGALIRALRNERGMTQKELADGLGVTDRAVSKWERGLCAPDIALLEPLAEHLGCSVLELIAGERQPREEAAEQGARRAMAYSIQALAGKVGRVRRSYLLGAAACIVVLASLAALLLWQRGTFFVLDRKPSPDGARQATVYSKELTSGGFSPRDAVSLIVQNEDGSSWRVTYGDHTYLGLWWAPDSQKYVLALEEPDGGVRLALAWLERNSESNLSAYLTMGVEATELSRYGYLKEEGWPDIRYQFLQWGTDSASMLIHYSFQEKNGAAHSGYFWYNCLDGSVKAVLELAP